MEDILFPTIEDSQPVRHGLRGRHCVQHHVLPPWDSFQDLYAEESRQRWQRELIESSLDHQTMDASSLPGGGQQLSEDDPTGSIAMGKLLSILKRLE
jgi:hypothetical protein